MATRILPRVTYQPPEEGGDERKNPRQLGVSGRKGYMPGEMPIDKFLPWIGEQVQNIDRGFRGWESNPLYAGNALTGGAGASGQVGAGVLPSPYSSAPVTPNTAINARNEFMEGNGSPVPQWGGASTWNPLTDQSLFGPANASKVTYNPSLFGSQFSGGAAGTPNTAINNRNAYMENAGAGAGQPPTNTTPSTTPTAGPGNDQTVAAWQATLDKNQNLTQQAKDTGNEKELARLQAEWDRIAPMAQKYGITPDRLVNSYMQPGNPAAESSLERAMGKAIADDTWAQAATIAFGRPPNQLEWDEHWRAMNKGGRDPLEGHPQAIQAIQQRMQEIQQDNQNQAFGQYQQWLNSQT